MKWVKEKGDKRSTRSYISEIELMTSKGYRTRTVSTVLNHLSHRINEFIYNIFIGAEIGDIFKEKVICITVSSRDSTYMMESIIKFIHF